jgi:hypothetical protein
MSAVLLRFCRCYPLNPRGCESCRDFLNRKRQLDAQTREQQAGETSLRELRRLNQQRLRHERYGEPL